MGDIVIGSSFPTAPPQETATSNPSPTTQQTADNSLDDAKSIGLDFGKSFGSGFLDYFIKKDHGFGYSVEHAIQDADKDLGKTAINLFIKQATTDPQSPLRLLLSESGEGYFSPAQHDPLAKPTDLNAGKPESKDEKPKGFDVSVGFPKVNLTPRGSFLDLATKPSPANLKNFSIGDKIELSYRTSVVDVKVGVAAEGSLGFQGAKNWSSINKTLLEKQGQGSVTPSFGLNVHPNENFSFSVEAGTQFSSKVGPDNHRSNTMDLHLGLQLNINLPGGTNPKKEEVIRKENLPKDTSPYPSKETRWAEERQGISLPAPEPDNPVRP